MWTCEEIDDISQEDDLENLVAQRISWIQNLMLEDYKEKKAEPIVNIRKQSGCEEIQSEVEYILKEVEC